MKQVAAAATSVAGEITNRSQEHCTQHHVIEGLFFKQTKLHLCIETCAKNRDRVL